MTDARLKSFVERIELVNADITALQADRSSIFEEAAGDGYDAAGIRRLIAWRGMSPADRQEREITDDMYRCAVEGGQLPEVRGVQVLDDDLARAISLYRAGATVRDVQATFKAEGKKISVGTAHKLKRRAKPFLDAERAVHVQPPVNVNNAPYVDSATALKRLQRLGQEIDEETGEVITETTAADPSSLPEGAHCAADDRKALPGTNSDDLTPPDFLKRPLPARLVSQ